MLRGPIIKGDKKVYRLRNQKTDIVFKKLFASKENEEILRDFVSSIIDKKLESFELENHYSRARYINSELAILNIRAKDSDEVEYDIKILFELEKVYYERSLNRLIKYDINERSLENNYNKGIKRVLINIVDFSYSNLQGYHNIYTICNTKSSKLLNDVIEVHFIELNKFKKEINELKINLDIWTYFLNNACKMSDTIPKVFNENKFLASVLEKLGLLYLDPTERYVYEIQLDVLRDKISMIEGARKKGFEEGKKIVEELIEIGINIDDIANRTNLSGSDILELIRVCLKTQN